MARELFTERGYDATSLREISDHLGFTKAALYYHFQSKEQLLRALLDPVEGLVDDFLQALDDADDVQEWAAALEWVIGQMQDLQPTFRLMQRNRSTLDQLRLGWNEDREDHVRMHERLQEAVREKSDSVSDQVRMICALAAVAGFDDWAPDLMASMDPDRLAAELRATIRDILHLPGDDAELVGMQAAAT
jgi:AcrR family transcriptional regulator